jgi:hypothetical protein
MPKLIDIEIRELSRDELVRLHERRATMPTIKVIRDSHHQLARLTALGLDRKEICEQTGYSYNRLAVLAVDPAFKELVAEKRKTIDQAFAASADVYADLATRNMIAAERHIADQIDQLDAEGELLPVKTALAISRDAADRFGYGKRNTQLNVNVDFAKNLEGMLRRSGKGGVASSSTPAPVPPVMIDVTPLPLSSPPASPEAATESPRRSEPRTPPSGESLRRNVA